MDKNIAALLDTKAYTVGIRFTNKSGNKSATYTYVCNIAGVKVGDWIVVDAPDFDQVRNVLEEITMDEEALASNGSWCLKGIPVCVQVTRVDADVAIEADAAKAFGWVIAVVDFTAYQATLARNSQISGLVAEAYKKAMRKSFAERILGDLGTDKQSELMQLLGN